jgi:hypothetical protein
VILGCVAISLSVGLWTIVQLFVLTWITGSIFPFAEYVCVPAKLVVVNDPSPKSILKFI